MRLNQVASILKSKKALTEREITDLHKQSQKEALFNGFERTYQPLDEEKGQRLPAESQKVQLRAAEVLKSAAAKWSEVWSLVLTQDAGNQLATGEIVVDGKTVLSSVPLTTLLYFEKQLNDLEKFVEVLPTPDPAKEWEHDPNAGLLRSKATESLRTTKEPTVIVKYEATKEHPAQTELFTKDVPVGTWRQMFYSGCLSADKKQQLLQRVRGLQEAVKMAREQSNIQQVDKVSAAPLFAHLLDGLV